MTGNKRLVTPSFTRRTVRRGIALFSEGSGTLTAAARHLRREGNALVCAEGHEALGTFPAARLYSKTGHRTGVLLYTGEALETPEGERYPLAAAPIGVYSFFAEQNGAERLFALTSGALLELGAEGAVETGMTGGSCAAVHYERIFVAKGRSVCYSAPLDPADATYALQRAGELELPEGGDIHAIISYRDDVYLFRDRSITRLFARGDVLSFSAEAIPFACAGMVRGSVCVCGDEILFLTERGVCSFNGSRVKEIGHCGASLLKPMQETQSASCGGAYYCPATLLDGERCIWCVRPDDGGHFIRIPAEGIAADGAVYCLAEGRLLRLTGRGLPSGGAPCELCCERSMLSLSDAQKYVDSVTIEGEGRFLAIVGSEKGVRQSAAGWAGERLDFSLPVKGNSFCIRVQTYSQDAVIRCIALGIREERRTW